MIVDKENAEFNLALQLINTTDKHIFLNGKAGTGKTTFLKTLNSNTHKKFVIACPTGVAAINAAGTTIHSLFNLPLVPYVPENFGQYESRRLDANSKKVIAELDTLVIDEVSMLRVDILDAIDYVLKKARNRPEVPFGGVQMVFIGDLFQLSPVASKVEQIRLSEIYSSLFFIDSFAVSKVKLILILLDKIYRQTDLAFISILNAIRNNSVTGEELQKLNLQYKKQELPSNSGINLTTHNRIADELNLQNLKNLPGPEFTFEARIEGEFDVESFPTDKTLTLKLGAKIMLLKNDRGLEKKYFNGKIGIVEEIGIDKICVKFDSGEILEVEKETWSKTTYVYESGSNEIRNSEVGTFQQLPIRLAWAITIHKSQGLTFEVANIDVGEAFAPGQTYVALSRLRSPEGLILKSPITEKVIMVDPRIQKYVDSAEIGISAQSLIAFQRLYIEKLYLGFLDFSVLSTDLKVYDFEDEPFITFQTKVQSLVDISTKFHKQLQALFLQNPLDKKVLIDRVSKAAEYFDSQIADITVMIKSELGKRARGNLNHSRQNKALLELQKPFTTLTDRILAMKGLTSVVSKNSDLGVALNAFSSDSRQSVAELPKRRLKVEGDQQVALDRKCLDLFNSGVPISKIASILQLNVDSVEHHLTSFLKTGEISIFNLISSSDLELLRPLYSEGNHSILELRKKAGTHLSFGQIKAAMAFFSEDL